MQQATACRSSSLTSNLQGSAAVVMTRRAQEDCGAPTSKKLLAKANCKTNPLAGHRPAVLEIDVTRREQDSKRGSEK
jgi:hypothetical protein